VAKTTLTITEDRYVLDTSKGARKGTLKIDPTKTPKTVNLTETEGDNKGNTTPGIYEFSGDTRKVCLAPTGKERPSEFAAPSGSGNILIVLKRVKK